MALIGLGEALAHWPNAAIPEEGLASIRAGAGVTIISRLSSGAAFLAKSVVYASADRGTHVRL